MKHRRPQPNKSVSVQTLTWWQQWMLMRSTLAVITCIVLFLVAGTGFVLLHLPDVEAGIAGAPVRSGIATLTRKAAYEAGAKRGNFRTGIALTFRIEGHYTSVNAPFDEHSGLLNEGQEVVLTYQVGKSGTYYVVDWQAPRKVEIPLPH